MGMGTGNKKPSRRWLWWILAAVALWIVRFGAAMVAPGVWVMFAGLLGAAAIVIVWLFASRAPWVERLGAVALMIAAVFVTSRLLHPSLALSGGRTGGMFYIYCIPILGMVFAVWAAFGERLPAGPRRASMAATILLACGVWTLLRTDGTTGGIAADFAFRWSATWEERLLSRADGRLSALPPPAPIAPEPAKSIAVPTAAKDKPGASQSRTAESVPAKEVARRTTAEWPGLRGPGRDSIIPGTRIETDWSASPPVELWRRPIGPGWSSFAVSGDLIYTQEQRGDDEIVTCYNATTGKPVWAHYDKARYWEAEGGAGPRATPAISGDRVYALGATGLLNALDARSGAVLWSRNAATDTGAKDPGWGFAGSPLVLGEMVIVAVSGRLAGYDAGGGAPRWVTQTGGGGYSSPHLVTIAGVEQVLLLSASGATSVTPSDGKVIWKHEWKSEGTRIMQPAVIGDGDLLISTGDGIGGHGIRRIAVAHKAGDGPAAGWSTEERWTSNGLKPNFNDFVIHDGHAYGFDRLILACIDLKDGKRKWKGGRYGAGQMVLLRDQGVLLVVSEEGGLALVKASPEQFTELARAPAIEGKTWNHPVLVGDRLLVRNGNEMAALRLPVAGR